MIMEAYVNCVEGHDEILSSVYFLECFDDTGFGADLPHEILMWSCIVQNHALFIYDGKVCPFDGARIMAIVSKVAVESINKGREWVL